MNTRMPSSGAGAAAHSKNLRKASAVHSVGKPSNDSNGCTCMGVAVRRTRPCVLSFSSRISRSNWLGTLCAASLMPPLRRAWWASSRITKSHGVASSSNWRVRSLRRIRWLEANKMGCWCHAVSSTGSLFLPCRAGDGYQNKQPPSNMGTLMLNFSRSSSCHWCNTALGAKIKMRLALPESHACLITSPAWIVLPRPTSSAISNLGGQCWYMRVKACT